LAIDAGRFLEKKPCRQYAMAEYRATAMCVQSNSNKEEGGQHYC